MIGTMLGHYRVTGKLGEGGMGEVFRALDTKLGREVAIKLLPAAVAGHIDRLERLKREAQAIAALRHPNIVTLYSFEDDSGVHFIVMELVEGETLRRKIPAAGMALSDLFALTIPITDALAEAHKHSVIHRDLKPDNIMIEGSGGVKILDFGLAKYRQPLTSKDLTESLTETGRIVGTPHYMSPEQVRGQRVDTRTDIFSLGVMLYEMATGKRPFEGRNSAALFSNILHSEPKRANDIRPELPWHLGRIIHRCLEKEPDRRYQSALDVRYELEGLKEEVQSGAQEGTTLTRGEPPRRWNRIWAWRMVILAIVAAAYWLIQSWSDLHDATIYSLRDIDRVTSVGDVDAVAVSPDGRLVAYSRSEERKSTLWVQQTRTYQGKVHILTFAENRISEIAFSADGEYIYLLRTPLVSRYVGDIIRVPTFGGLAETIAQDLSAGLTVSPDGKYIAFVRRQPEFQESALYIVDADGDNERVLIHSLSKIFNNPAWSPDGHRIALMVSENVHEDTRQTIRVISATGGQLKHVSSRLWLWATDLAWLADGSGLLIVGFDQSITTPIWRVAYPSGEVTKLTTGLDWIHQLDISRKSGSIVLDQSILSSTLWVGSADDPTDALPVTSIQAGDGMWGLSWMDDKRILFSRVQAGRNFDIWMRDLAAEEETQLTFSAEGESHPCPSDDPREFLFASDRGGNLQIWRRKLDRSDQRQLTDGNYTYPVYCTLQGRAVLFVREGDIWRLPLEEGKPQRLTQEPGIECCAAVSPDGRLLAYGVWDETVKAYRPVIVSAIGGGTVADFEWRFLRLQGPNLGWTPNGKALAFLREEGPVSNIWTQPIQGGQPKPLTRFTSEKIFAFAFSPDGKQVVMARGKQTSDVFYVPSID